MTSMRCLATGATALGLILALQSGSAQAFTQRIFDAPLVSPEYSAIETWQGNNGGNDSWGDELGGGGPFDGFSSAAIDVTWTGPDVSFTLYTNFGLSGTTVGGLFVGFADLFIDLGNDGTQATPDWDYAVDFKSEHPNTTPDNGGAKLARLVTITDANDYDTSVDVVSGTTGLQYGGRTNICDATNSDCKNEERAPETKVTKSGDTFDLAVEYTDPGSIDGPNGNSVDYGAAYTVTLLNVNQNGDWDNMRVFWGTGWCANDTVEGTAVVPIPAALPMLLAALGGLGFAGWRRRNA